MKKEVDDPLKPVISYIKEELPKVRDKGEHDTISLVSEYSRSSPILPNVDVSKLQKIITVRFRCVDGGLSDCHPVDNRITLKS